MNTLFYDDHNVLLNGQPYPFNSLRPRYPVVAGDNTATLWFPWYTSNALWSGDVRGLINGDTGLPFTDITEFKTFCDNHLYTTTSGIGIIGFWDASTNTPTLANGTGAFGSAYICTVPGTVDFGAGPIIFIVGDLVAYDGAQWIKLGFLGIPSLQQVSQAGNTTTDALVITDTLSQPLAIMGYAAPTGETATGTISAAGDTGVLLATKPDGSSNGLGFFNPGGTFALKADALTGNRVQQLQDQDGTIALLSDVAFALSFLGSWDASANTPTLANGDPNAAGDFYITSTGGTVDFGAGPIVFTVGDLVAYTGSIWQNGGPGTSMSLQQVTSIGNTTTSALIYEDGSGNTLAGMGPLGADTVVGTQSAAADVGMLLATRPDGSVNELRVFDTVGALSVQAAPLTATRTQQLQDDDGTIALEQTMTLEKTTLAGNTTTTGIKYIDGSGNLLAGMGAYGIAGLTAVGTQSDDASTGVGFATKTDSTVNEIAFYNTGGRMRLVADTLTGIRTQQFQDKNGTVALTSDLVSPVNAQTGTTYTPLLADAQGLVTCDNASPVTVTIPAAASVAFPVGTRIDFAQLGAGKVSFTPASGVTINSQGGNRSIFDRYVGVTIIKTATDTWLLVGNLSA